MEAAYDEVTRDELRASGTLTGDTIRAPRHYVAQGIQPIEYIYANKMGFLEGNVIKYVTRYRAKGGVEDLRKARQYLDWLIEHETKRSITVPR